MDASGFVPLPVLLQELRSPGATEAVVRHVVASDLKGRYELDESSVPPRIRAVQGHSVHLAAPQLAPVGSADEVPLALHITSLEGWKAIQDSGELRRMSRTHVHFGTEPGHLRRNSWATVLLRLDLRQAMQDGHAFFLAANGVLLCEGPLPARYLEQVQRDALPPSWNQQ
ncbi:hypothetical protein CHLNCDRAFT_138778 [Chlorella variabilis]|uniref:2'-phosphotransferase n=1 Tax=Chlorella variabilis TaxID=554065 RepID=E1ZNR0_CHLVA|nr:hypothetical protein CHLNCDRAFT_138778 [Chlorella variabilis]EFN52361.1 hypothetical protein CHLNCDRAFT_138778 [Chlorella variabilis]|eukprot:XP_005844463.1 hypothetical protein CHLNCDRAFT_138778 [Chlorella variabilis]